jgi:hypothetical protein
MKQLTIVFLILTAGSICHAQNKNLKSKYAIKLNNLVSWEEATTTNTNFLYTSTTTNKKIDLFDPTVSVRVRSKNNNSHEIELTQFEWNKSENTTVYTYPNGINITVAGGKTTITNIALRYEYILNFCKGQNSKWMPALGFGAMPYFQRQHLEPALTNEYPGTATKLGMKAFVVPRINYAVSSKFFIDFNIPLCVSDLYFRKDNTTNPNLTISEQKSNTFNFDAAKNILSFRVGVGVNI